MKHPHEINQAVWDEWALNQDLYARSAVAADFQNPLAPLAVVDQWISVAGLEVLSQVKGYSASRREAVGTASFSPRTMPSSRWWILTSLG